MRKGVFIFTICGVLWLSMATQAAVAPSGSAGPGTVALERRLSHMLSDRNFTAREQAEIAKALVGYYGLAITYQWNGAKNSMTTICYGTRPEDLARIAHGLREQPKWRVTSVTVWREPSANTIAISRALARQALSGIKDDLLAAKAEFSELANFAVDTVRLTDDQLWYAPVKPSGHQKMAKPTIGISIRAPLLAPCQVIRRQIIFPRQKLAVERMLLIDDSKLNGTVEQVIKRRIEPLMVRERLLGGKPIVSSE